MLANTRAELDRLLQVRNQFPEQAGAIDAKIREIFSQTHAIVVLDMSGFSRLTMRYSVIHFLAMVRHWCSIATPLIERHQGSVVKREADNIFAIFPTVERAIDASAEILQHLALANLKLPESQDLYASVGIGYGEVLMVDDRDMYGNEMNLACKLGEDLARAGEILLTAAAFAQVERSEDSNRTWERLEFSISGIELITRRLQLPQPL